MFIQLNVYVETYVIKTHYFTLRYVGRCHIGKYRVAQIQRHHSHHFTFLLVTNE